MKKRAVRTWSNESDSVGLQSASVSYCCGVGTSVQRHGGGIGGNYSSRRVGPSTFFELVLFFFALSTCPSSLAYVME